MFEEYKNISIEEAEKKLLELKKEYDDLIKQEKVNDKKIKKGLIFWLFIPVLGLFIYSIILTKRRNLEHNMSSIMSIKEKLVFLELEMQYIETKVLKRGK
ncbi:hypothetical protein SCORR_v1c04900 [Spiroplasma corruscae]|uniref:Uncharacterized protein n=1 Tax=Spiroplasma corruscae TaxID=216934 RepID=A0A222EP56_9MOLU|nr:hypothetical protein [Spiroplasma corruscae]ASP28262.1 hypothetical protein SCORR_v1c04900 [Spiroplasma corruscae]